MGDGQLGQDVIWGWRRSSWDDSVSRLVYFAGERCVSDSNVSVEKGRLVLLRRGSDIGGIFEEAKAITGTQLQPIDNGFSISIGPVNDLDASRVARLDASRRHEIRDLSRIPETPDWRKRIADIGRKHPKLMVYAGSGLSYEGGIPKLESMHVLFGVDRGPGTDFCLQNSDPLICSLREKGFAWLLREVTRFETMCVRAQPSISHLLLADAYRRGDASLILTDNVDEIFERRFGVQTIRTRGDGLTSEKFQGLDPLLDRVKRRPHALLVVGVSADRRSIIESFAPLVPTIVVNPGQEVSPHSKNLDYLETLCFDEKGVSEAGHVFVKQRSLTCLTEILSLLRGG